MFCITSVLSGVNFHKKIFTQFCKNILSNASIQIFHCVLPIISTNESIDVENMVFIIHENLKNETFGELQPSIALFSGLIRILNARLGKLFCKTTVQKSFL